VAVMMDAGDRILHVCSEQTSAAFFHRKKNKGGEGVVEVGGAPSKAQMQRTISGSLRRRPVTVW